jgi:hypothetical protein
VTEKQDVYIDFLCWESIYIFIRHGLKNCNIRYCQKSNVFPYFFIKLICLRTNSRIEQIRNISFTDEFIGEKNLYEKIHSDLTFFINNCFDKEDSLNSLLDSIVEAKGFDKSLLKAYYENKAFWGLYRIFEIFVIAKKISQNNYILILKRSPLSNLLKIEKINNIFYYNNLISRFFRVSNREEYHLDYASSKEFSNLNFFRLSGLLRILFYFTKSFLIAFLNTKKISDIDKSIIGVDQYQNTLKEDAPNDLFWLESGLINHETVLFLANQKLDKSTLTYLSDRSIDYARINPGFREIFNSIFQKKMVNNFVVPTFSLYKILIVNLFSKSIYESNYKEKWIYKSLINYELRESYWRDIYKQLNIKIFWSMSDGDQDVLIRYQSIKKNEGFFIGSNYSYYQFDSIHSQKIYDVYFSWGKYFSEKIMKRHLSNESISLNVGYVADSHFNMSEKLAKKIKDKFKNNYIISYLDNNTGNDFELSVNMNYTMISFFIILLEKYSYLTLFLKPKRQLEIDLIVKKYPKLKKYIDIGRVLIFIGESHGERFPPAIVGKASNLVVCLGINTAGIECFAAGSRVIYANLSKFNRSKFYSDGKGKNIFNSENELKEVLENIIKNRKTIPISEKESIIYNDILAYQDGRSYIRVGWCISHLQSMMKTNKNKALILEDLKNDYNNMAAKI